MVSLTVLFWMYVILFAVIGAMRGWAKELLVAASAILAIFIITLAEMYIPQIKGLTGENLFWVRTIIITLAVLFGYQTPNIHAIAGARFVRESFQDILLGLVLGAVNGYLVVGTSWYYMSQANYPFAPYFAAPDPNTPLGQAALALVSNMPPALLNVPWIYFAVGLSFLFVIVVFI